VTSTTCVRATRRSTRTEAAISERELLDEALALVATLIDEVPPDHD
jgi:hypothetical protein